MAAEANARAERLEVRVQQLTEELDARGGYRRVSPVKEAAASLAPAQCTDCPVRIALLCKDGL